MPRVNAVVVDGDKTLWRGRAAEGIGKAYLLESLKRGRFLTVYRGVKGAKEVEELVERIGGVEGEIQGQKRFYEILVENGLGSREAMLSIATTYIDGHIVDATVDLMRQGVPIFLSTASGTSAATAALAWGLRDSVSNTELFDGKGRLTGIDMTITTGENKLAATVAMLDRYNIRLSECMVIGDSGLDVPLLRSAQVAYASPFATDEVKAIRGIREVLDWNV